MNKSEVLGYECDSGSVEEALQISGGDIHQAINLLLDKAEDFLFKPVHSVATHSLPSVGDAVAGPSSVFINDMEAAVPCILSLSFYKNTLHKPVGLTQKFVVEFVGE